MKKLLFVFLSFSVFLFTACDDDEANVSSYVKIKVSENGTPKSGVTVCMFSSKKGFGTDFFKPFFADKKVVTESNGIATFELQEIFNLETIDTQTTLYFGIFKDDKILGKTAITIKKGETKTAEINY